MTDKPVHTLNGGRSWARVERSVRRAEARGYPTTDEQLIALEYLSELQRSIGVPEDVKAKYAAETIDLIQACVTWIEVPQQTRFATLLMARMVFDDFDNLAEPWVLSALLGRRDPAVARWRAAVLKRDGYTCQSCGSVNDLHAHHIEHWADAPSKRVVLENGITLCRDCHVEVHRAEKH